jgi:hypothetical protein
MSIARWFGLKSWQVWDIPLRLGVHHISVPFPDGGTSIRIQKHSEGLLISADGMDAEGLTIHVQSPSQVVVRPRRKDYLEGRKDVWIDEETAGANEPRSIRSGPKVGADS